MTDTTDELLDFHPSTQACRKPELGQMSLLSVCSQQPEIVLSSYAEAADVTAAMLQAWQAVAEPHSRCAKLQPASQQTASIQATTHAHNNIKRQCSSVGAARRLCRC